MDRRELRAQLKDWARWQESQTGYSSHTVIAAMMDHGLNRDGFHAALPHGIEPHQRYLRRLIHAMRILSGDQKKVKYIRAMQVRYLIGPRQCAVLLDRPSSTVRRWCRRGEHLLEKYLDGHC